ncbi:hypothetical protein HME9304_00253 [Flagellimonas maritima]|uniref:HTH araC/xylS-type domain-containing protein n=1 Tax=Flagellimonas maritima TaxID=1383885 RepID=A0A2Z4LNB0_9FLAO|nr:AraC family transcriptional regulator [Allomuricauda aurantiaca]AWX43266.1 hypothetical protein HME9304_00253 [Allomuricauda aurantiaca]
MYPFIKNVRKKVVVKKLAGSQGISSSTLQNGFRTVYGISVSDFIQIEKVEKAI